MDDGAPGLEVEFIIEPIYDGLLQAQRVMESAEYATLASAKKIEQATRGMLATGNGVQQITAIGPAATQAAATTAAAFKKATNAGEAMSRQLQYQIDTFGMSKAAARAYAAELVGNGELTERLRAQEASLTGLRSQTTAALHAEAVATAKLASAHAELAAKVQGSHAAQEADAVAAERLRMTTDPLYAATKRLNAEIAESTRLYYAGATAPAEYARQQQVLTGRLTAAGQQHDLLASSAGRSGFAMRQFAIQLPDIAQGLATGQKPMMVFLQQGGQIAQIAMMAEGGIKGFASQLGQLALKWGPVGVAIGTAVVGFKIWQDALTDQAGLDQYVQKLGLTKKEIESLKDVTVTSGDIFAGLWKTIADHTGVDGSIAGFKSFVIEQFQLVLKAGVGVFAELYGSIVGTYRAAIVIWKNFGPAIGDVFYQAVNLAITALNKLLSASTNGVNGFIGTINSILGTHIGTIMPPEIKAVANAYAGAASKVGHAIRDETRKAVAEGQAEAKKVIAEVNRNIVGASHGRLDAQANKIIGDRTPKTPKKDAADHQAEQLARENEAVEAQIRNLYALADAYGVSGAAALIAEARVKAESDAIKKRGDIEMFVNRQVRLVIAQRVSDAAKASAGVRDQTDAQRQVNDMVAAGIIPAERAAELVKGQIADLPLLAAIEAARQQGLAADAARATKELESQRAARAAANVEAARAKVLADTASAGDQLDRLKLEASLINATNKERAVALAQLEVEQYLRANPGIPADEAAVYRRTKAAIASMSDELATARTDADLLLASMTAIADQASVTAGIMSSAFGNVGNVVGGVMTSLADYRVQQQQMAKEVMAKTRSQASMDNALATLRARNTAQTLAGMKNLFDKHSTGYKIMATVEKAHAALQLVNAIRSMVLDRTQTASSVANSGIRAAADGVAAVAKAIASLPFPLNLAAGAATAAALVAFGVRMFSGGGGGGGSGPSMPTSEDVQAKQGTGSVLGDSAAKSESISRSLEIVASNSNRDLEYSNQMLRALRSIDTSISKMASTVAQQVKVSGSMFDTSRLNLGSSGSGGFLGIGAKNTTRSLYDAGMTLAATTVGDILAGGINGSTYQIVEQIKKKSGFFGIGGSTKTSYSTTTGAIDPSITGAVQDVVLALRDGIVSAADVVGIDGAKAILDSLQVSIGKISFNGLTGEQIEDQLQAIFSKVGDDMASAVFPGLKAMQHVGEGLLETLSRVGREYEVVDVALKSIGKVFGAVGVSSVAARDALIQLFGSLDDFTEQTSFFRDNFLSEAEQIAPVAAAVREEMTRLGLAGITTRDQFKQAVLGLDLTTAAGRDMYASLLAVAPAFDKVLDSSEKAAKDAVSAADELRKAWSAVGDSIRAEIDRIRGVVSAQNGSGFATLQGQFNAAVAAARSGDQEAAKNLPNLSKALLDAAALVATSRQELNRVQAVTASTLESVLASLPGQVSPAAQVAAAGASSVAAAPSADANTEQMESVIVDLRSELAQLRSEISSGLAVVASNTGKVARKLDDVTAASGGNAIAVDIAA